MIGRYIGNIVHAANVAGVEKTEREKRRKELRAIPDNRPSKEWLLDEFTKAVESGDMQRQSILLDAWEAAGYELGDEL